MRKQISQTNLSDVYVFTHKHFSLHGWVLAPVLRWLDSAYALPRVCIIKEYDHSKRPIWVSDGKISDSDSERPDTPDEVISLREAKTCQEELDGYQRLRSLQGTIVPECYGKLTMQGPCPLPAIGLQLLDGQDLGKLMDEQHRGVGGWDTETVCRGNTFVLKKSPATMLPTTTSSSTI